MLKNSFDPAKPYTYVSYGRMSSDKQNPRSPEQQFATIEESLRRLNYPWTALRIYRDDGISGRFFGKRNGLQSMLADIQQGLIQPDLILVDTLERFGRADKVTEVRRRLFERHGVLVLTADSHFADPTSVSGRALGFVENLRATEENRVKAHNVLRGKRDAVRQGKWPGGNPPFGYRLESVLKKVNGRQEVDYSHLVPDPPKDRVIKLLFAQAENTGHGSTRLAKFLNEHPDVPADLKPFPSSTVGFLLKQSIYFGRLIWEKVNTEVMDDRRVCQHNPEEDRLVVDNFCTPLVTRECWEAVQKLRRQRTSPKRRTDTGNDKLIKPPSRGVVLKYPLTGLVRCGVCGRAMVAMSSKPYITKAGEHRRYTGYFCPVVSGGTCENKIRVPEDWLRSTVVDSLLERLQLLPSPANSNADCSEMLSSLTTLVEQELKRMAANRPSQAAAIQAELTALEGQMSGWSQSLGRPDLPEVVRRDLEQRWSAAGERATELRHCLVAEESHRRQQTLTVDQDQVLRGLQGLHATLTGDNATMANFQLAQHIDTIRCFPDRTVVVRICKLGVLPNVEELVARFPVSESGAAAISEHSRRRGRLALDVDDGDDGRTEYFAMAPDRFHGLPEQFFWEETFTIPVRKTWAEQHADEVYERRQVPGMTYKKLISEFGKSRHILSAAVRIASKRREA